MAIDERSKGDNLSIQFGDSTTMCNVLEKSRDIKQAIDAGESIQSISERHDLKRALTYKYAYLCDIREDVLQHLINGRIGLVPLVDLHKEYGNDIGKAIAHISKEREQAGRSIKATLKEIKAYFNDPTNGSTGLSDDISKESIPVSTVEARECIGRIQRIIHESTAMSQLSNGLFLDASDVKIMMRRLGDLEQWLDDLNPAESGDQGDPLDQSVGSYVFENMVDSPVTSDFDPQYNIEDENQDIEYLEGF